jgi:hypothetical protein
LHLAPYQVDSVQLADEPTSHEVWRFQTANFPFQIPTVDTKNVGQPQLMKTAQWSMALIHHSQPNAAQKFHFHKRAVNKLQVGTQQAQTVTQ